MEESSTGSETPFADSPNRGISHTRARMAAEGATWLATGEVPPRDESEPYGQLMTRLEAVVPPRTRYDWLVRPNDRLDGQRPIDLINADQLEPLQELVDSMPEVKRSSNGAG